MKILIVGDLHLTINNLLLGKNVLKWINEIAIENDIDMIVNLGDTNDNHAIIRSEILNEFTFHIEDILKHNISYYYIIGNHDLWKPNDNTYHAFYTLKNKYENLIIIDDILHYKNMTFVPFIINDNNFPTNTRNICFAHQMFYGANLKHEIADFGVKPDIINADIVISGHIHTRQKVGKIFYPGTPYSRNMNDIDEVKGIHIFDTESYDFMFFESPFPKWKKIIIDTSSDNYIDILNTNINKFDNFVVEISGLRNDITRAINDSRVIDIKNNTNLRFKPIFLDSIKKSDIVVEKTNNINDILKQYVNKIYSGLVDKEELISKSIEIIKECNKSEV